MKPRALALFLFPSGVNFDDLESRLEDAALKPVGPQEMASSGFIPPFVLPTNEDGMRPDPARMLRSGKAIWITRGVEKRLLPGSVINDQLAKKLAAIEAQEGRKLGARTRRKVREDLILELLPRAFVQTQRTDAILDIDRNLLAIATSSRKAAEDVVSLVREALGSFPALPASSTLPVRATLTGWVAGDAMPDGLGLGAGCEFRSVSEAGSSVRFKDVELSGKETESHLRAGRQVARLDLVLDDRIRFSIGDDLIVRSLTTDIPEGYESREEDMASELEAMFRLAAADAGRIHDVLAHALAFSPVEG